MKKFLLVMTVMSLSFSTFADNDDKYQDLVDRLDVIEQSTDTLPVSIVDNSVFIFTKTGDVVYAEIPKPAEPLSTAEILIGFLSVILTLAYYLGWLH